MDFIKKLSKNFIELTRMYALPVTIAPCLVVWAFAHYCLEFSYLDYFLLVFALCCVHLGANLFDDYMDVKNKLKTVNFIEEITFERFTLKADLILKKVFSLKEVEVVMAILFIPACIIGLYFAFKVSFLVSVFALLGGILIIFYPIAPKFYLGEMLIGTLYGPLLVNGGYYALVGAFNYNLFLCSIAIFFSTIVLLYSDNIMDWEFDVKENKKTLCILSKSKQNAIKQLRYIITISYLIIVFGVLSDCLNPNSLYVFLTLPVAVKLLKSLDDYINIKNVKFESRWYWGMFENWEKIKEAKIDFFMYRMYLARNYVFFFALFLAIGTVV